MKSKSTAASIERSNEEREAIVTELKKPRVAANRHFKFPVYVHQQIMKDSIEMNM